MVMSYESKRLVTSNSNDNVIDCSMCCRIYRNKMVKRRKKKVNTLDKVLILLGAFLVLFIIAMIVLFCLFQSVPDTLIVAVLGSGSTEAVLCCIITCIKKKVGIENDEQTD